MKNSRATGGTCTCTGADGSSGGVCLGALRRTRFAPHEPRLMLLDVLELCTESASDSMPPRTEGAADVTLEGGSALEPLSSPVVGGLSVSVVRLLTLAAETE